MSRKEVIGDATLYLGDCMEILPTLPKVDAVITDPPYGVAFRSGWTGAAIAGDEDVSIRDAALQGLAGIPAVVFGSHTKPPPVGTVATVVWHRPGSGMGDLSLPWKPDFEMVFIVGKGFRHETRGSGVLSIPWDVFRGDAVHPHQKPIALMQHFVERAPCGLILDPFMGSGSTGVASLQLGREFVGIERDPTHFATACRRIEQAYKQRPLFVEPTRQPEQLGLEVPHE